MVIRARTRESADALERDLGLTEHLVLAELLVLEEE